MGKGCGGYGGRKELQPRGGCEVGAAQLDADTGAHCDAELHSVEDPELD
jgi:hypothetical protein